MGHRLPGLLVVQVQHSPHFLFLKGWGNAHKMPSVSPSFLFPHKGPSGAESRRVGQSKTDSQVPGSPRPCSLVTDLLDSLSNHQGGSLGLSFIDLPACGVDSWPHREFLSCLTVVFDLLVILFPWTFVLKKKQSPEWSGNLHWGLLQLCKL